MTNSSWNESTNFIFSYNINEKALNIFDKYQEYLFYKNNPQIISSKDSLLEFQVLSLLENLGFPMIEVGTYLYSEVIIKIIKILNTLEEAKYLYEPNMNDEYIYKITEKLKKNLLEELNNSSSYFYSQLANKDMQLSLFHSYINKSVSKLINNKHECLLVEEKIIKRKEINYGILAYNIATQIISNKLNDYSLNKTNITVPTDIKKQLKLYL